jgi:hypothetical protein
MEWVQAAGLQADDVLVRMGKFEIKDFGTLGYIIGSYKAGDLVDVEFYRGGEKKTLQMKLSGRPIPEIPPTPQALSKMVAESYARGRSDLTNVFAAVSETAASHKPSTEEWVPRKSGAFVHSGAVSKPLSRILSAATSLFTLAPICRP